MCTALPDHVLIAPLNRLALPAAVARASRLPRCVLWLDDMERFLGPEGLSRSSISRLTTGGGHHRVVVGTLRSAEMTRYTAQTDRGTAALSEARETLEQAVQLRLARLFTWNERCRARTRAWDSRIADALNCAGDYGLAAALPIADASEAGRLASTAHDYGLYAIGAQAYSRAHQQYRTHLGALHPKTLTSHSSLAVMLRQLGRLAETEQCARAAVEAMVSVAGHRAVLAARLNVMSPEHPNTLSGHADLALVLCEMGRLQEAEAQHRIALDTRIRLLGSEHPDTLSSRSSFAGRLRRLGRLEEAEQEHAAALEARRRTLGDEHRWSKWSRSTAPSCGHVYACSGLITPKRGSAGCTWPVSCET